MSAELRAFGEAITTVSRVLALGRLMAGERVYYELRGHDWVQTRGASVSAFPSQRRPPVLEAWRSTVTEPRQFYEGHWSTDGREYSEASEAAVAALAWLLSSEGAP